MNPYALAMSVALGTLMAFLTPLGHAVNILVMGTGGYKFRDYTSRRADDDAAARRRARVPAALLAAELVCTKISRRFEAGRRFFVRFCYLR